MRQRSKLQLLGATALWVGSKFEDLAPVDLASLCWISDNAFTPAEVVVTERALLVRVRARARECVC